MCPIFFQTLPKGLLSVELKLIEGKGRGRLCIIGTWISVIVAGVSNQSWVGPEEAISVLGKG